MEKPHQCPISELYQSLDSHETGLSDEEAERRLKIVGTNELHVRQQTPGYIKFLLQFKNFFAILLMVGGSLAFFADYLDPEQGNFYIGCALYGVVLLNAIFTFIQAYQSEKIMQSFQKMLPTMVNIEREGEVKQIAASQVVPGDIMLLYEGDKVSADGRLVRVNQLQVDMSSLTGESTPETLQLEADSENPYQSRNMVFSGTLVQSGNAKVLVCETGMATQIGKIVELTKQTSNVETPIGKELNYFIKIISSIAIVLGISFFAVSVAIGKGEISSLIFAIGIIVANVPEGLLPTVTLALTMASKRMARKNALIKNLESVETLGSTTVICTDKTGTLTQNKISVNSLITNQREYDVGLSLTADDVELQIARRVMTLCNNAHLDTELKYSGDSTEVALLAYAEKLTSIKGILQTKRLAEKPFTSEDKYMVTVNESPEGDHFHAYLKGAPEVVMAMCDQIHLNGQKVAFTEAYRKQVVAQYMSLAERGERGLALAYRNLDNDGIPDAHYIFVAVVGMIDPPRVEVPEAILKCRQAGIRVFMLTGDFGPTAKAIGKQIGLFSDKGKVLNGDELSALDDAGLSSLLNENELIFARITPAQKLQIVQALQKKDQIVTVTGDGVNDAPALKNADMGVAMGLMGTDVAKEASNMVLMDDNFATIVTAIEEGRTIFDNIKKFIAYILTSNIPQILPFIAYVLLDIPLPLTVVLILAIDLGTDIIPALGLGSEKPETDVMNKPPRARHERLLTRNLLFMSYGIVGMIQAAAGFFSYFYILLDGGWQWGEALAVSDPLYRQAITAFFASIIICQIADVLICRTRRQSILTVGIFANRLVLLGIASELILLALIAYVPLMNTFFGTAPLELWQLSLSIPFAITIIIADEIRRVFVRRENSFVLKWLTW
ncbi:MULTISPECIES: HAD-IC family P-type ATPase [Cycloclasticus]|uniref:Sodium/potassium-transporting ATPase subunit alpha n=1 Tax=Cycloclasticus pugetii TaxID=34068 RepID=A0AB33Z2X5_9GAMM|nr:MULTISPECIES: HAD-IC family P-type ATPase [Cycloclasticus]ATI02804.1 HAD family hydrolase [Cycloclasticus sp. PY97N]EPD13548.1 sodium/potassium-transporting ATPase subunit alpha [Cycloclasticus pugetii]